MERGTDALIGGNMINSSDPMPLLYAVARGSSAIRVRNRLCIANGTEMVPDTFSDPRERLPAFLERPDGHGDRFERNGRVALNNLPICPYSSRSVVRNCITTERDEYGSYSSAGPKIYRPASVRNVYQPRRSTSSGAA